MIVIHGVSNMWLSAWELHWRWVSLHLKSHWLFSMATTRAVFHLPAPPPHPHGVSRKQRTVWGRREECNLACLSLHIVVAALLYIINHIKNGFKSVMETEAFHFCCHRDSLIVMFMHANVSQNTLWGLLCVKRAARIEPWGLEGEVGTTEPTSVSTAQRAKCTRGPRLFTCLEWSWNAAKRSLLTNYRVLSISCKYSSLVTMFWCKARAEALKWNTEV